MRLLFPFFLSAACLVFGGLPAGPSTAEAGMSAKDRALVLQLKKQRLTKVQFKDTDLKGIVKWLRVATSKNILIKRAALAKADIDWEDIRWTVTLEKVGVWTFLEEVVAKPHGMALKVKGNILFITSKADSFGKPVTRMYAISHITWTKVDFIGPDINLKPSGFTDDDYEPEVIREDDPLATGDAVADLLKEILVPKLWDENDSWNVRATDRYLVIRAPKAVHNLVPRTLSKIAAMK